MSKEEFLRGKSKPLNESLMKIAINIEITDQTGKGNKDIVSVYGPEAFEFSESFLTVKIPYNLLAIDRDSDLYGGVIGGVIGGAIEIEDINRIYNYINSMGKATTIEIVAATGISKRTVERRLASMKKDGMIIRVGAAKNGHWETQPNKVNNINTGLKK